MGFRARLFVQGNNPKSTGEQNEKAENLILCEKRKHADFVETVANSNVTLR